MRAPKLSAGVLIGVLVLAAGCSGGGGTEGQPAPKPTTTDQSNSSSAPPSSAEPDEAPSTNTDALQISVADAQEAREFTGDLEAGGEFIVSNIGEARLEDGREFEIYGQLPDGRYVATAFAADGSGPSTIGTFDLDGAVTPFSGTKETNDSIVSVAVNEGNVSWITSSEADLYPTSWRVYMWDGSSTVEVGDNTYLTDSRGVIPWSLGVSEAAQATFATQAADGAFQYHAVNASDFESLQDLPKQTLTEPKSVGNGFVFAVQDGQVSDLRYASAVDSAGSTAPTSLFAVNGALDQDNPIVGSDSVQGVLANKGDYAGKPTWLLRTPEGGLNFIVDATGAEPSEAVVCGSALTWVVGDGETNSSRIYHLETESDAPKLFYLDFPGVGSISCARSGFVFAEEPNEPGPSHLWHYEFDASL